MAEACRAFGIPVVGGNVSLYNESRGRRHRPDPGRRPARAWSTASTGGRPACASSTAARSSCSGPQTRSLAGSRWAWERGHRAGPPPDLDLELHAADRRRSCATSCDDRVAGVHDASDGMGVALAEMAVRSGVGFDVSVHGRRPRLAVRRVGQPGRAVHAQRPRRRRRCGPPRPPACPAARIGDGRRRPPRGQGPARRRRWPRPPRPGGAGSRTRSGSGTSH